MSLIKAKQLDSTDNYSFNTVSLGQVTPTAPAQAASKAYVDSVASGLDVKLSVRAATTANIDLSSAPSTIDGVSLNIDDRVLVKNQTTGSENGIYIFNGVGSAMTRSTDADEDAEVTAGLFTFVEEGITLADSGWVLATDNPITLNTTDLVFTQFTGAGQIIAGNGLSKTGNQLDVNVDNTTIEIIADTLQVKDNGISNNKISGVAATKVSINDTGNYYTSTDVEGALQEIGNDLSSIATGTSVSDLEAAVGSSTGLAGLDYSSNNYVTDATSLETAIGALDTALKTVDDGLAQEILDRAAADTAIRNDLASTAHNKGASLVGIEDLGTYYTSTTVEGALQEIGAQITGAGNIDTRLDNLEAIVASTTGLAGVNFTSNHVVTDGTDFQTAISALDAFFGNVTTADLNKLHDITSTAAQIDASVNSAHNNVHDYLTVGSNGQTSFTLAFTPKNANAVAFYVNGAVQAKATDFTISGTTLTWISTDFALATTDKLLAIYDVAA
jgi:hypothetical protein